MPDLLARLQRALGTQYRVEEEMVRGGMSRLFRAHDVVLDRAVVVKVLPPDLVSTVSVARFQREIAVAAHFQHPHVLPILAAGAADGLVYYVMPWVDGESLRERLRRDGRLPLADALRMLTEIADALAYAHAHGVVHRDVKPGNILVTRHHAVLVDFGIAHAAIEAALDESSGLTTSGNFIGTAAYMAPEQFRDGHAVDGRADVFALGVVAYEAIAGRLPYGGRTPNQLVAAEQGQRPPPLHELRPDVPVSLSALLGRAIEPVAGDRVQSAVELHDALREELAAVAPPPERRRRRRRRRGGRRARLAAIGALVIAGAVAVTTPIWRGLRAPALDDDLVAIAPFEVIPEPHRLWREGLVDVLSVNLDGAGPLRTVSPALVLRRLPADERRDVRTAAASLGERTGARWVVVGRVLAAGPDSLRVAATLVDAATGRAVGEVEVRDVAARMDRIADSLTVAVLREIGARRPVGAVRRASIGARSLPALRAFLEGEQHFRRTAWDSARAAYQRAIALDDGFALAHSHLGLTYAWQRLGMDSVARVHALRAGALNHGLAPRESLLVLADSLRAAAYGYAREADYPRHVRRLFATLEEATRRYGQDAEVWYRLGDARFHFAIGRGYPLDERALLADFDRAIALDSAFAPAYIHPVELAFAVGDRALALRYAHAYAAARPSDVSAAGTLLAAHLLNPGDRDAKEARSILDTASADLLFQTYSAARRATDRDEVAARILRLLATGRPASYPALGDPAFARRRLAQQLAWRGRIAELRAIPEARSGRAFAEAALAGGIPVAEARAVLGGWLASDPRDAGFGTPALASAAAWWAAERDTASLLRMRAHAAATADTSGSRAERPLSRWMAAVAEAHLALARADTAAALRRFASLERAESPCALCAMPRLVHARLLAATGRLEEARAILHDRPSLLPSAVDVLWALERGRVAERLGSAEEARAAYRLVASAWRGADAALRPIVNEARDGIARLAPER